MKKNTSYILAAALTCLAAILPCGKLSAQSQIDLELGSKDITITSSTWIVGEEKTYGTNKNLPTSYDPATQVIRIYMDNQAKVTTTSGGWLKIVNPENGSTKSSVEDIIDGWNRTDKGIKKASGHIHVIGDAAKKITIILDGCFSTYQVPQDTRKTGGLGFEPTVDGAQLEVRLKGDNRFGNVAYSSGEFTNCKLIFTSADGDGKASGTLTVADIYRDTNHTQDHSVGGKVYYNWYNSVIGGADSYNVQNSKGIEIRGGTIYAGALEKDNCTAIGGGGNGIGTVKISGGVVTAVTSSTGTAIGGGIGWTDFGGASTVEITGGQVYAYNHGFAHNYNGSNKFVPATAIGGGSSFEKSSNKSIINISGGEVYAQSVGGVAIGGGGSGMGNAGDAEVNITGGTVYASNVSGQVESIADGTKVNVPAGTSIGGGTGGIGISTDVKGNGGSATVKISGSPKLIAGSIGGGATNSAMGGVIGYADITITGNPVIQGQFMMQKSSKGCSFTMNGGTINNSQDNSSHYVFKKDNGGALCMIDEDATATITAGSIYGCNVNGNGGAIYMEGGTFNMTGGVIGDKDHPNKAKLDGGGVYIAKGPTKSSVFEMTGNGTKSIIYNVAGGTGGGVFVADGTVSINNGIISNNVAQTGNGGGVYTTAKVDITGASEISNNTAKLSGGGVYVKKTGASATTVTLDGKTSVCKINGNSADGSHTETYGGGGIYLSSGTVTLNNATVDENNAPSGLGGGIYVGSGDINVNSGSVSKNTSYDGGGLYAGGGIITFTKGGTISYNVASHNGGGVYASAADIDFEGDSKAKQYAEISFNTARNGAGIYMCQGAFMLVRAAFVNGNTAVIDETEAQTHPIPKSAFWSYTQNNDANNKQYLQGIGGGVYLDSGISQQDPTLLKFDVKPGENLGIFSNRADIAADDIFANGQLTQVIIPAVDEMEFEGFGGKPTGWYEDYMTNDVRYTSGTFENNRSGATGIRYRTAYQSGLNMFKVDYQKASAAGRYVCLALGDPFSNLVIKVSGLKKGESAVYTCTKSGDTKPTYYVVITGVSDEGTEVSRTVKNVPIGDWIVEQTEWNWAYNLSSDKQQTGNVGVGTDHTPVLSFANTANTGAAKHGESITKNVFDTVVTAVEAAGVIPREQNNTNIDL